MAQKNHSVFYEPNLTYCHQVLPSRNHPLTYTIVSFGLDMHMTDPNPIKDDKRTVYKLTG